MSQQFVWTCPSCARAVPKRLDVCRCGCVRPETAPVAPPQTAPIARPEPAPVETTEVHAGQAASLQPASTEPAAPRPPVHRNAIIGAAVLVVMIGAWLS